MIFCGQTIHPGEQKEILVPADKNLSLKALCFCGSRTGKTLVLTAGVHGCEYVGVESLKRLARILNPCEMTGNAGLLPLANPSGFFSGTKRTVPEDGINLNRAFPGNSGGSLSARLAWALEQALYPAADLLADLHSGDADEALSPLVFFPVAVAEPARQASLAAAKALTVAYRVPSAAKNGLYSWAAQKGVPALLIERGGQGTWSEEEVSACLEDIAALFRHLEILPSHPQAAVSNCQQELSQTVYEEARHTGFWYPAIKAGQKIKKGQLLGKLEDLSGNLLQEIYAEFDGLVLYHSIGLGVQKGDNLVAYGQT